MEEARRLAYIKAMGIDSYLPRDSSVEGSDRVYQDQVPYQANSDKSNSAAATHDHFRTDPTPLPAPTGQMPSDLTRPSPPEVISKNESPDAPLEQKSNTPAPPVDAIAEQPGQDQMRFALQYFAINDQLAVINEVPYLAAGQLDNEAFTLLRAILRALKIEVSQLPAPTVFQWPLDVKDAAGFASLADAMSALEGFMNKRQESSDYSCLLIFADQCAEMLLDNQARLVKNKTSEVVITHSLQAMLKVPALKKSVWETIRNLEGGLKPQG
jgi:hypothetical protein